MVGAPSFSQPYLCIQPTLQSASKTSYSSSVNFHLPISPLLFHKVVLTVSTNTPFLHTSATFHLNLFAYYHPNDIVQKIFSQYLIMMAQAAEPIMTYHCPNKVKMHHLLPMALPHIT